MPNPDGSLTLSDVSYLQGILGDITTRDGGGLDRAGFYLAYAQLIENYQEQNPLAVTGARTLDSDPIEQVILQSEITTYSGFNGGAALLGNALAKYSNPVLYNLTLDQFSYDICQGQIDAIAANIRGGGTGILSSVDIRHADRGVWDSKGMGQYFPGNKKRGQS